jgi:hypothetical protein
MKKHNQSIHQMPDLPQNPPLDWKFIANRFNSHILDEKNNVMFTDSQGYKRFGAFVEDGNHELITYGGIILGKRLRGDLVEEFLPTLKTYFSDEYSIFLNHPANNKEEYWYLMLVNCYAFEIIRQSLHDQEEYLRLVERSIETLMNIAKVNDYNFNDQGFDFSTHQPFTNKNFYRQPDTVGAYSYLMLVGYEVFGEEKYLQEALIAMKHYQSFTDNPWYEIPSGAMAVLAATRLIHLGYSFDLEKIVDFTMDPEQGCLHIGKWGDEEINGLMRGWRGYSREEASQTAYSLESLLLLPFLLPVAGYQKELAEMIGKYALHVAANARLFFGDYLDADFQSRPDLPTDVPYETLHCDKNGKSPYAFGDFHTHKSVYGGAYTLWWDAMVEKTSEPNILQLNISRTDFFRPECPPLYMYYNPYPEDKIAKVNLKGNLFNVGAQAFMDSNELTIEAKGVAFVRVFDLN